MLYVYFLKRIILVCLYFSPSLFISPFYLVSYYCCLMEGPQDKCFEVPENSKSYKYQVTNKYYGSNDLVSFRTVSRPLIDF